MKQKNRKKLFIVIFIALVIITMLFLVFSNNINMKKEDDNNSKKLKLVYTLTNSDYEKIKIGDKKYDTLLAQFYSINLKEEGKYYVGNIDVVNPLATNKILDYVFAEDNTNGVVIEDAKFELNKKKVYIPKKYYKNDDMPIKFQVLSYANKNDIKNIKFNVKTTKFLSKNKKSVYTGYDTITKFSIENYNSGKKISKDDITILINDKSIKLKKDAFEYDKKSGVLEININSLLLKNVNVIINRKYIFNSLFSLKKVNAELKAQYTLDDGSSTDIPIGTKFVIKERQIDYVGSENSSESSTYKQWTTNCNNGNARACAKKKAFDKFSNDDYVGGSHGYIDFMASLSDVTVTSGDYTLVFDTHTYIVLGCVHGSTKQPAGIDTTTITLTVTDKDSDSITFSVAVNQSVSNQEADGLVKFNFPPSEGIIKVKKQDNDNTERKIQSIEFDLYSDDKCTKYLDSELTNKNGVAKFTDLTAGTTYYVSEVANEAYEPQTSCKPIKAKEAADVENIPNFPNKRKYYSFQINKKDSENSSLVDGATFGVYANEAKDENTKYYDRFKETITKDQLITTVTATNGSIVVCGLPAKISYYVREISNINSSYWNNDVDEPRDTYAHVISKDNVYASTSSSNCSATNSIDVNNTKKYYCMKVKKVDKETGIPLSGAIFEATNGSVTLKPYAKLGDKGVYQEIGGGVTTILTYTYNNQFSVREVQAPVGYAVDPESKLVTPTLINKVKKWNDIGLDDCSANADAIVFRNQPLFINWYKIVENEGTFVGEDSEEPEFEITDINSGNKIYHKKDIISTQDGKKPQGSTRNCYQYSSTVPDGMTEKEASTFKLSDVDISCIRAIPEGTYKITETKPGKYHTFGDKASIEVETSTEFKAQETANTFKNLPTSFEFTKKVKPGDGGEGDQKIVINGVEKTLTEITIEELKKLDFEVYEADASGNPTGNPLTFIKNNSTGVYEYTGNTIDPLTIGPVETILHLNDDKKIRIDHLEWGKEYVIREVQSKVCDASKSENDCIGYYYPNYNEQSSTFILTTCSNPLANTISCPNRTNVVATQELINTPTEIQFTKADYYHYEDQADIIDKDRDKDNVDDLVEFENDKERSDFDRITFKMKDSSGTYLTLKFIKNVGDCKSDSSYALYKYVPGDQSDEGGTELHTCGGHIHITNLCRGNKYTMEEISVPDDSVFVKENTDSTPTTVDYTIPCTDGSFDKTSTTHVINDKGTYVRFEKRDSKYNYAIPDETTTFQVYRCKKGEECHPSEFATKDANGTLVVDQEKATAAGMKLMKFAPRAVIAGDEEDPEDLAGLSGVEVYKGMSDSDAEKLSVCKNELGDTGCYVTNLHPYHGILVLRYLQASASGYNYVLLETKAPKNYTQPLGEGAETKFTISNQTVDIDPVDVPNKPTSLLIRKYSDDGNLLPGAEFKIYQGTANNNGACDANLSPMNQPKTLMKFKTIRDGVYEYRPELTDDIIKTCEDEANGVCSGIPTNESTDLTYSASIRNNGLNNTYEGSWADWSNTTTSDGKSIEIQEGEALIQYLEYGHCYIIEEVKAPEGYSLPKNEEDRYSMVYIDENDSYYHDTEKDLINSPTPFTFYKYDEFNNLLDGAEFKLQKLDDNKKYHDVTVSEEVKEDGTLFYKVDPVSNNLTMRTHNGSATVYFLTAGQYRIVETKAAPGKEINKNPNIATFFVDSSGNVYGNALIVNKEKTEKIDVKPTASAELIVNIQTGQTIIRYGLIISILIAGIAGLMIYNRKRK